MYCTDNKLFDIPFDEKGVLTTILKTPDETELLLKQNKSSGAASEIHVATVGLVECARYLNPFQVFVRQRIFLDGELVFYYPVLKWERGNERLYSENPILKIAYLGGIEAAHDQSLVKIIY